MILTGKIFKYRCMVGDVVQPAVVVLAADMSAADKEVLLYAAAQPGYIGEGILILSATEIDLETL